MVERTNKMSKLYCDLCGIKFNTHIVKERRYHDYEPYEEEVICPNENECHLVKNYICNDCFDRFEEIIREKMISAGNDYVNTLNDRLNKLKEQYERSVQKAKAECKEIEKLTEALKNADLSEIDEEIYGFNGKFPYSTGFYYLDSIKTVREMKK